MFCVLSASRHFSFARFCALPRWHHALGRLKWLPCGRVVWWERTFPSMHPSAPAISTVEHRFLLGSLGISMLTALHALPGGHADIMQWQEDGARNSHFRVLQNVFVCAVCSVKLHPKAVAKNCYKSSLTCVHVYSNTMEYVAFVCHSVGCVLQNYLAIPESLLFHYKILCALQNGKDDRAKCCCLFRIVCHGTHSISLMWRTEWAPSSSNRWTEIETAMVSRAECDPSFCRIYHLGQDFRCFPVWLGSKGLGVIKVRKFKYKIPIFLYLHHSSAQMICVKHPAPVIIIKLHCMLCWCQIKANAFIKMYHKDMDAKYTIQIMIHQNYHCKNHRCTNLGVCIPGKLTPTTRQQQLPCSLIGGYCWNWTLNTWIVSAEPAWFIDKYRMFGETGGTSTRRMAQVSRELTVICERLCRKARISIILVSYNSRHRHSPMISCATVIFICALFDMRRNGANRVITLYPASLQNCNKLVEMSELAVSMNTYPKHGGKG